MRSPSAATYPASRGSEAIERGDYFRAMDSTAEIAAELDSIAERLLDRSLDLLRQATESDPEERDQLMAGERRLTRARRAVEKAANLLRSNEDGDTVDP